MKPKTEVPVSISIRSERFQEYVTAKADKYIRQLTLYGSEMIFVKETLKSIVDGVCEVLSEKGYRTVSGMDGAFGYIIVISKMK